MRKMNLKDNMKLAGMAVITALAFAGCGGVEENTEVNNQKTEVSVTVSKAEEQIETKLDVTEAYDPFADIEISFVGLSNDLSVNLDHLNPTEEDTWIRYTVKTKVGTERVFTKDSLESRDYHTFSVENGDTLTFTAEIMDWSGSEEYVEGQPNGEPGFITKFGKTLSRTTYDYVVEGVESYVKDASEIGEGLKTEIDAFAKSVLQADFDSWGEDEKILDMKLADVVVKSNSRITLFIYEVNATNAEAENFTYYWTILFSDFHCAGDFTSYTYNVPFGTEGESAPSATMSGYYEGYQASDLNFIPAGQQWHSYFGFENLDLLNERYGL